MIRFNIILCLGLLIGIEQSSAAVVGLAKPTALQRLIDGNNRYVKGDTMHPRQDSARRGMLVNGQKPFAVVVGCSDSRVPPEIVFDTGLGDLFVIRVAGNVLGELELESLIFAVKTLEAPMILVLGHEGCAAIAAALTNTAAEFDIAEIGKIIKPLVPKAEAMQGDPVENLTKLNVKHSVEFLKTLPDLRPFVENNKLQIAGGYYTLESGSVSLLFDDPN